jgi:hypothetical protein
LSKGREGLARQVRDAASRQAAGRGPTRSPATWRQDRRSHWYPKAVKRLRDDYERAGDAAGFGAYLDGLRERQRRKYSFIAKLDAAFGT